MKLWTPGVIVSGARGGNGARAFMVKRSRYNGQRSARILATYRSRKYHVEIPVRGDGAVADQRALVEAWEELKLKLGAVAEDLTP